MKIHKNLSCKFIDYSICSTKNENFCSLESFEHTAITYAEAISW